MEQSLGNQLAMHCLVERPYCLTLLAEAVLRNGDPERAARLCTEALALALASEGRNFEAESHRVRAEAWFSLNRVPEAETECQVALSVARAAGCGALELRAARSHLRIARARPGSDYDVAASS